MSERKAIVGFDPAPAVGTNAAVFLEMTAVGYANTSHYWTFRQTVIARVYNGVLQALPADATEPQVVGAVMAHGLAAHLSVWGAASNYPKIEIVPPTPNHPLLSAVSDANVNEPHGAPRVAVTVARFSDAVHWQVTLRATWKSSFSTSSPI
jgi:hypothetical protein